MPLTRDQEKKKLNTYGAIQIRLLLLLLL